MLRRIKLAAAIITETHRAITITLLRDENPLSG
jgi:hypothetical protein